MLTDRVVVPDAPPFEPVETWPGQSDMARLQKLIWAAKQPVMLLGGSRWSQAACDAVMRFAERFALPVATVFRRGHLFDALHPCYAGDLGIGPNPKLMARIKGADLVIVVGDRLGEMASQSYTLFEIPGPRQTFVHVHPCSRGAGPRLSSASRDPRGAHRLRGGARRPAAAERDSAGARARAPLHDDCLAWTETPTAQPGGVNLGDGDDVAARSPHRPTPSCATAPAISPPGSTASIGSAASPPTSRRPRARWATACRRRWR